MSHKTAVKTGQLAEQQVAMDLERAGFACLSDALPKKIAKEARCDWFIASFSRGLNKASKYGNKFYLEQVMVRESIYGNPVKVDFVAFDADKFCSGMVIECKTQSVAGSVDEKYPYTYLTMENIALINQCKAVFYLGGGGARQCVYDYLSRQDSGSFRFFSDQSLFLSYLKNPTDKKPADNQDKLL